MAFGQTRDEKVRNLQKLPEQKTAEKPVAIPVGNIGVVNLEQQKKPHNINIRNYNPNEPKRTPNMKYSDKQRYRRYKTKTEPNLLSKIQVNEEDDIINKIKEAFGIKPDDKGSNYSEPETAPAPFYKGVDEIPELPEAPRQQREPRVPKERRPLRRDQQLMEELNEITTEEAEELTFKYARDNEEWERFEKASMERLKKSYTATFADMEKTYDSRKKAVEDEREKQRDEAAKILQYNIGKRLSRKANKVLAADLADAMTINRLDDTNSITVSSVLRRNKKIGLEWFGDNSPKRQERYSSGLDAALPTPKKIDFKPNTSENITKRRAGRPVGTYGPVRRIQEATERTPEENIAYFKSRKNANKAANKPQLSLQELRDRQRNDEFRLQNFMFL